MLFHKSLDEITKDDIDRLVENEVQEGFNIEFKKDININTGDNRKEFLFDVTAFANHSGGDLVVGIREENDIAKEIIGIDKEIFTDLKSRLADIIMSNTSPVLHGVKIEDIRIDDNKYVMVIRVPNSFAKPHMVTYKRTNKFYIRKQTGKELMDVSELRNQFNQFGFIMDKVHEFRNERKNKIQNKECPVELGEGPRVIFHLIPINSILNINNYDIFSLNIESMMGGDLRSKLELDFHRGRINLEGKLYHDIINPRGFHDFYFQLYRNGIIECCCSIGSNGGNIDEFPRMYFKQMEITFRTFIIRLLNIIKELEINPPILISAVYINIKDYKLFVEEPSLNVLNKYTIDRTEICPQIMALESYDMDLDEILKPIFDTVWNAAGFRKSFNYNDDGKWIGEAP